MHKIKFFSLVESKSQSYGSNNNNDYNNISVAHIHSLLDGECTHEFFLLHGLCAHQNKLFVCSFSKK